MVTQHHSLEGRSVRQGDKIVSPDAPGTFLCSTMSPAPTSNPSAMSQQDPREFNNPRSRPLPTNAGSPLRVVSHMPRTHSRVVLPPPTALSHAGAISETLSLLPSKSTPFVVPFLMAPQGVLGVAPSEDFATSGEDMGRRTWAFASWLLCGVERRKGSDKPEEEGRRRGRRVCVCVLGAT